MSGDKSYVLQHNARLHRGSIDAFSCSSLRAGCRNARLTARLGNRELTVTARLTCGHVARSKVSKP